MFTRVLLVVGLFGAFTLPVTAYAQTACEGLTGAAGSFTLTLESGGMERTFRLDVPAGYDPTAPTPVVFNFHGFTSNATQQAVITDMPAQAGARGWISVHPEGYLRSWNAGECCGSALAEDIDDVGFVRDMIAWISERYCVDPARIHATGFSNGGYMSHRLACEMSDTFASVAPDAGLIGVTCTPTRPIAVHQTHGTQDNLVPYEEGYTDMQQWATQNGCVGTPQIYYTLLRTTCVRWAGCDAGSAAELCTIDGGGHWWYNNRSFSTTDTVLDFFEAHPMP